ncbi:MAG: type III pantothenate kinase [Gammaproteobacteria bacterium]|nr:MAG: type III pantothenate kinase [Gammaproteobacteria bacterium]
MINLLIDAGNTRLKWCWYDGTDIPLQSESCEYEDFEAEGAGVFADEGHDVERIVICSVAGSELNDELIMAFDSWPAEPEFLVSEEARNGVQNAYHESLQLGVDRWMNLLGAVSLVKDAVCIVDCGSAVTIDVVDDDGQHLGGMIIPGLEMMREVLLDQTAEVEIDAEPEPVLLARDTASAVNAGTLYAVVALIDRVRQDISSEMDTELPMILTGGDAYQVQPLLGGEVRIESMLIFHGMITALEEE